MPYTKEANKQESICEIVRKNEQDYIYGTTTSSKYVQKSMYDDLNKIDAYLNSKHVSGETDSLGRDKPFFNIVTAAVNIWYRATDIDRKDIQIKPTRAGDTVAAFLANIHLHQWMKKNNFGTFLNDWGRSLARYGSSVVKFVEKDGELYAEVIPWQRLIVDTVDFDNNVKIEVLELTEAQLRQREGYDKEVVNALCNAQSQRKTLNGQSKDQKSGYIKLYEVHGELPLSLITDDENDNDTYVQQMHTVSFVATQDSAGKVKYDDYTLVKGREEKDPYMITHLIKEDGQTLSIGAVQHLFEAQWMMNHTVKSIKDQLDLASKLIFQTSDASFVGQNALSAIETGDILIHAANQPLTQLANSSHDITSLQAFGNQWKALSNEIVGISESMLGNTAPSGTAWRQVETLLQQNQSLFELMTENKGLYIEEMLRNRVIPNLKKKLDTKDEVVATLDMYGIDRIEDIYLKNNTIRLTNNLIKARTLRGQTTTPSEQVSIANNIQTNLRQSLSDLGGNRFFKPSELDDKTWKEYFKDFEWDCEVNVTNENIDKDAAVTYNSILTFLAKKAGQPLTPEEKLVFNKMLDTTSAISSLEFSQIKQPVPQLTQPAQQNQPTAQAVT